MKLAGVNIALSLVLCLAAVWLGHVAAASLTAQGRLIMQISRDTCCFEIFIGEDDKYQGRPLYEAIVLKGRERHLAAQVLRGPMGFGHSSRLHTAKILRLSEDLPIIIEIVDEEAKIKDFLPELEKMMGSGLVTLENQGLAIWRKRQWRKRLKPRS